MVFMNSKGVRSWLEAWRDAKNRKEEKYNTKR
jgi:hypothetical protein